MHIHLRQYPEAFDKLNAVLRQAPLNHEAYWMKGMIYRDQGNAENAKSSFQTAVEVNPNFFDGFIALGLAYAADMDTLAIGFFETAKELRPQSVEARYNLAYFLPGAQTHPTAVSRPGPKGISGHRPIDPVQRCSVFQPRLHSSWNTCSLRQRRASFLQGH